MKQEVIMIQENEIKVPQNPFGSLTESELDNYIKRNRDEIMILDQVSFKKYSQRITKRDPTYLEDLRNIRNGLLTVQRQVRQIAQILEERSENTAESGEEVKKQWRKMRKACALINKNSMQVLETVREAISDYQFDFPNEKSTSLKNLVQLGAITAFAMNIAGLLFGENLKAKGIAAAGAIATGLFINKARSSQDEKAPYIPSRWIEQPYEIRQAYAFLS